MWFITLLIHVIYFPEIPIYPHGKCQSFEQDWNFATLLKTTNHVN